MYAIRSYYANKRALKARAEFAEQLARGGEEEGEVEEGDEGDASDKAPRKRKRSAS